MAVFVQEQDLKVNSIRTLKHKGVEVKSDLCLYGTIDGGEVNVVSLYGSPQQVKAIEAAFLSGNIVETIGGMPLYRYSQSYKIKNTSIGYGKCHGLLWLGDRNYFIWRNKQERMQAFEQVLRTRKIPFLPEWLPWLERMLKDGEYLVPLYGWGAEGYVCYWDDDKICQDITKVLSVIQTQTCL